MAKYRSKKVVEALTFDEFLEYGKTVSDHTVDGMPWSFEWNGAKVTHETDNRYGVFPPGGWLYFEFVRGDYIVFDGGDFDSYDETDFAQQFEKSRKLIFNEFV